MINEEHDSIFNFKIIKKDDKETIKRLRNGEIDEIRISMQTTIDEIINYGLKTDLLKKVLESFPDPRKSFEVPLKVLLLPQIMQNLSNETGLGLAPQMINNSEILSELGFAPIHMEIGFNNKNKYERIAPFNGETLKHVLNHLKPECLIDWFNDKVGDIFSEHSKDKAHKCFVLDGMEIELTYEQSKKFPNCGVIREEGELPRYGYKLVWILELLNHRGIIKYLKLQYKIK